MVTGHRVAWAESGKDMPLVQANIHWSTFLARHDMIWKRLPGNWREAPWTGNGMLGSMFWIEGNAQLTWQPDKNAMPTRPGYARTKEDMPRLQKQYKSRYPTEPFPPNPDAVVKSVDDANVCIQEMLGGSRHCTAWRMIETGKGKQRLVVSIANRWPREQNDPVAESVAVVKKVCVSVPDIEVETVYWTTMYKLGSATRADRVMIDTAGIWQTPSRWADSHWDFNIPYCYYPIPTANRLHLAQSLIRNIGRHRDNLIKNVRPIERQEDSSYLPVNTGLDLYQPMDIDPRSFRNTGGHFVWAMHACWPIYRGSMDDAMLRETVYPILRRAANYQIHRLQKRDGKYHAPVSHSPEYGDAPDANYELAMLRRACHAVVTAGKLPYFRISRTSSPS